jgi:hypothetical protein
MQQRGDFDFSAPAFRPRLLSQAPNIGLSVLKSGLQRHSKRRIYYGVSTGADLLLPRSATTFREGHSVIVIFKRDEFSRCLSKSFKSQAARMGPTYNADLPSILDEALNVEKKALFVIVALSISGADNHRTGRVAIFSSMTMHLQLDSVVYRFVLARRRTGNQNRLNATPPQVAPNFVGRRRSTSAPNDFCGELRIGYEVNESRKMNAKCITIFTSMLVSEALPFVKNV